MRAEKRFQCRTDLKEVRHYFKLSKETVAEKIFCSVRTLERIEKENATSNEETAIRLCELYDLDYEQYFYFHNNADRYLQELLLKVGESFPDHTIKAEYQYYCIYIRRISNTEDVVFGKGMYVRDFGKNKEVRKISKINIEVLMQYFPDTIIINEPSEWFHWYMTRTIGKINRVAVSEKCMRKWLSGCFEEVVVKKEELLQWEGFDDMICLGKKERIRYGQKDCNGN